MSQSRIQDSRLRAFVEHVKHTQPRVVYDHVEKELSRVDVDPNVNLGKLLDSARQKLPKPTIHRNGERVVVDSILRHCNS